MASKNLIYKVEPVEKFVTAKAIKDQLSKVTKTKE